MDGHTTGRVIAVTSLPDVADLPHGTCHRFALHVATLADGLDVRVPVNIVRGAAPGPRLVVVGGVHGDEHEGPAALVELSGTIAASLTCGTLVAVPVANPPAFAAGRRRSPRDEVDMNRVFPGDATGSITNRIAHRLVTDVAARADLLVSIHGWTAGWLTLPFVEYPGAGPTSDASRVAAAAFGVGYVEPLGELPGRLMTAATALGIPMIEAEVGGEGITLPERRTLCIDGVVRVLEHLGMAAVGTRPAGSPPMAVARTTLVAPRGGLLRRAVALGDEVETGQPIATVCGLNGEVLETIAAPRAGVVALLRHAANIEPGDIVASLLHPLESGSAKSSSDR